MMASMALAGNLFVVTSGIGAQSRMDDLRDNLVILLKNLL